MTAGTERLSAWAERSLGSCFTTARGWLLALPGLSSRSAAEGTPLARTEDACLAGAASGPLTERASTCAIQLPARLRLKLLSDHSEKVGSLRASHPEGLSRERTCT